MQSAVKWSFLAEAERVIGEQFGITKNSFDKDKFIDRLTKWQEGSSKYKKCISEKIKKTMLTKLKKDSIPEHIILTSEVTDYMDDIAEKFNGLQGGNTKLSRYQESLKQQEENYNRFSFWERVVTSVLIVSLVVVALVAAAPIITSGTAGSSGLAAAYPALANSVMAVNGVAVTVAQATTPYFAQVASSATSGLATPWVLKVTGGSVVKVVPEVIVWSMPSAISCVMVLLGLARKLDFDNNKIDRALNAALGREGENLSHSEQTEVAYGQLREAIKASRMDIGNKFLR